MPTASHQFFPSSLSPLAQQAQFDHLPANVIIYPPEAVAADGPISHATTTSRIQARAHPNCFLQLDRCRFPQAKIRSKCTGGCSEDISSRLLLPHSVNARMHNGGWRLDRKRFSSPGTYRIENNRNLIISVLVRDGPTDATIWKIGGAVAFLDYLLSWRWAFRHRSSCLSALI